MRPILRWLIDVLTSLPSVELPAMDVTPAIPGDDEYAVIRRQHDLYGGGHQLMYGGWVPWDPTSPEPSRDD